MDQQEDPTATRTVQQHVDALLQRGVILSILWMMGIGSAIAVILGVKAKRLISKSDGTVAGMNRVWWCLIVGGIGLFFSFLLVALHVLATPRETLPQFDHMAGQKRLVVLVHGLPGRARFGSAVALAREALPGSDLLIFDYDSRVLSNGSPYTVANLIERRIHLVHETHGYDEIVLMGHSMGGMLLRKAFVWGSGREEDRQDFGLRGERRWVHRVSRFVSLATINRGWSIEPRPSNMSLPVYVSIWIGEHLARLSQSGKMVLALQRGSPFVADARVQWIDLCRAKSSNRIKVPQTIHLLGDRDDIVSKDDSMDLIAAKDTIFVTLEDTGHRDIATALSREACGQRRRGR